MLEQSDGRGVAGQSFECRLALGDELAREGAIAVQRRGGGTTPGALRPQLEGNLRARGDLGAKVDTRRDEKVRQGRFELLRTHRG